MRKLKTIATLCIVLLMIGCGEHRYPKVLIAADSLADVCPDSSLVLLESFGKGTAYSSPENLMYSRLLYIKATDKADCLRPDSAVVKAIAEYYEQKHDTLLPIAYYYAGRTYSELQDMPQALDYFQKALDAIGEEKESF